VDDLYDPDFNGVSVDIEQVRKCLEEMSDISVDASKDILALCQEDRARTLLKVILQKVLATVKKIQIKRSQPGYLEVPVKSNPYGP